MPQPPEKLFLPGFGASSSLYRPGLPSDWTALDPPGFRRAAGSLAACCRWLVDELDRRSGQVAIAGHSMGAALAITAAAARPERVARLMLIAPAGLPLAKPLTSSLAEFATQVSSGRYPRSEAVRSLARTLRAPRFALRLARAVHQADLAPEMTAVRAAAIECVVVAAPGDTLVTPSQCQRTAALLGAQYRELEIGGGHMWMLEDWPLLAGLLRVG